MKAIKWIVIVIGAVFVCNILLTGVNILQKGGSYKGASMEEILGVSPEKATAADIERLGKAEVFQLFYAARTPSFASMKGEYRARTLAVGIMAAGADFFTHNFFGPGRWEGKAFFPFGNDKGWGYNLFRVVGVDGREAIARTRKMDTFIGRSLIDDKSSFHLVYSPYNGGAVKSMRDEIRMINDRLYLGMGHMALGGGPVNPAPFILIGPADRWIGLDNDK